MNWGSGEWRTGCIEMGLGVVFVFVWGDGMEVDGEVGVEVG